MCFGGTFEIADQIEEREISVPETEEREISVPESLLVLNGWFFTLRKEWGFRERGRGGGEKGKVYIVFEDFRKAVVQWYSLGKTRIKQEVRAWYEE